MALAAWPAEAQNPSIKGESERIRPVLMRPGTHLERIEIRAKPTVENTFVPPPPFRSSGQHLQKSASFLVTYNGFSPAEMAAFQYAVDIWSQMLTSPVAIRISATWEPLESGVLGSAGPKNVYYFPGCVHVPDALADLLIGRDHGNGDFDIVASFNSTFGAWYLGTDGNPPPGFYDLVTVAMHEIGHGLGFQGLPLVDDGEDADECDGIAGHGCWWLGYDCPGIFDTFTEDGGGTALLDQAVFPENSDQLGDVFTGMSVFFDGPHTRAGNGGNRAQLNCPATWNPGSSYSHLDEAVYPAGNINSLMTPFLGSAEAIHSPGPITLGIFDDLGWDRILTDGFEVGNTSVWSATVGGP